MKFQTSRRADLGAIFINISVIWCFVQIGQDLAARDSDVLDFGCKKIRDRDKAQLISNLEPTIVSIVKLPDGK